MSKKPFNDIENIIIKAAAANEPAFDEVAWQKMEILLDKEKNKKRPFLFWWWLMPLILTGLIGGYFIFKTGFNEKTELVTPEKQSSLLSETDTRKQDEKIINADTKTDVADIINSNTAPGSKTEVVQQSNDGSDKHLRGNLTVPAIKLKAKGQDVYNPANANKDKKFIDKAKAEKQGLNDQAVGIAEEVVIPVEKNSDEILKASPEKTEILIVPSDVNEKLMDNDETIIENNTDKVKNIPTPKTKTTLNRFYINAVAGADGNGMQLFSVQKTTARFGLGIGYQINKNLSVQTGFYSGSKKYIAGPQDYKTKPGTYWNTVYIKKINADCRVFEIPLLLRWDFSPQNKWHIFSETGLSSYFMKKENYEYFYYRNGNPYQANADYNGNQSLFSVLRLNAGAERKIAKQLALNLSTGLAIPLAGLGEGQVKLYSLNLMFGLKYIPAFKKRYSTKQPNP